MQPQDLIGNDSHLTDEGIALYVDALKLNAVGRLPTAVRDHVAQCARCKREVIGLEAIVDEQQYRDVSVHPTLGRVRADTDMGYAYRIAAAILVMAGLGAAAYFTNVFSLLKGGKSPEQVVVVAHPDTATAPRQEHQRIQTESQEQLAANFVESPNLEGVVNSQLRSAGSKPVSPVIGEVVGGKVELRWESEAAPPFTLKILNNREEVRKTVTVLGRRYRFDEKLADGLYYWKLEANGELLFVGKFIVRQGNGPKKK